MKKRKKKNCLIKRCTDGVTDQGPKIGHFLNPLDVLGNTPNLRGS